MLFTSFIFGDDRASCGSCDFALSPPTFNWKRPLFQKHCFFLALLGFPVRQFLWGLLFNPPFAFRVFSASFCSSGENGNATVPSAASLKGELPNLQRMCRNVHERAGA
jgi:hypothetical protein